MPLNIVRQYMTLQVPKGLNALPPILRLTITSIVAFGPGPALSARTRPERRKYKRATPPMVAAKRLFAAASLNHNLAVPALCPLLAAILTLNLTLSTSPVRNPTGPP